MTRDTDSDVFVYAHTVQSEMPRRGHNLRPPALNLCPWQPCHADWNAINSIRGYKHAGCGVVFSTTCPQNLPRSSLQPSLHTGHLPSHRPSHLPSPPFTPCPSRLVLHTLPFTPCPSGLPSRLPSPSLHPPFTDALHALSFMRRTLANVTSSVSSLGTPRWLRSRELDGRLQYM